MENNPELILGNSLSQCKGLITRSKVKNNVLEESSIDMVIMSKRLKEKLIEMKIDEKKELIVANFKKGKVIETDHNTITAKFNLNMHNKDKHKEVIINYNDAEAMIKFKEESSIEGKFTNIFKTNQTLEEQIINFNKKLLETIRKCFKTIRMKVVKPMKPKQKEKILQRNLQ